LPSPAGEERKRRGKKGTGRISPMEFLLSTFLLLAQLEKRKGGGEEK